MKTIAISIACVFFLAGIFIFLNTFEKIAQEDQAKDLAALAGSSATQPETIAEYAAPLTFEQVIKTDADAILIGTVQSAGERFNSVTGELESFSTPYTITIDRKIKGFEHTDSFLLNVLESGDPGLEAGDRIFIYVKETKPGYYVPLTPEYGLKQIENGQIIGRFLNEEHRMEAAQSADGSSILNAEAFLADVEALLPR